MRRLPPLKPQIFQDIIFVASWLTGSHGRFKNGFYPVWHGCENNLMDLQSCQNNNLSFMKYLKDGEKIQCGWQSFEFISGKIKPDITPDILHKFPIVKLEWVITFISLNSSRYRVECTLTFIIVRVKRNTQSHKDESGTIVTNSEYKESENNKSR